MDRETLLKLADDPVMIERAARAIDPKSWEDDMPIPTRAHTIAFHEGRARSVAIARAALRALAGEG